MVSDTPAGILLGEDIFLESAQLGWEKLCGNEVGLGGPTRTNLVGPKNILENRHERNLSNKKLHLTFTKMCIDAHVTCCSG